MSALLYLPATSVTYRTLPTQDGSGWTVIAPSSDSRVVYVSSSSGNDTTGNYTLGSAITPGTAQTGLPAGAIACATVAHARTLVRDGYPDWILLKCGDTFAEPIGAFNNTGGRSAAEPFVISSYGASAARPIIQPASSSSSASMLTHGGSTVTAHIYLIGVELYNPYRDPNNVAYVHDGSGYATSPDVQSIFWLGGGNDILIEDCFIHFVGGGLVVQTQSGAFTSNVTLRRSIITDIYATGGHTQGTYLDTVDGMVIEECIFDHNSWNVVAGVNASIYNHHIYMYNQTNTLIRKNLFLRAESLSTKCMSRGLNVAHDITYDNNLYFEGEVGISASYSDTSGNTNAPGGGSCIVNLNIINNVFSQVDRDNPTSRGLGWGVQLTTVGSTIIQANVFSDFSHVSGNNYAILLTGAGDADSTCSSVLITQNILKGIGTQNIVMQPQAPWSGIQVINNAIQDAGLGSQLQAVVGSFSALSYASNIYSASNSANFASVGGVAKTYAQWLTASGETGSIIQTLGFVDSSRTLDSYVATLGMSLADYYAAVRTVSKANWHPEYLAPAVNDYVRAGFAVASTGQATHWRPKFLS